MWLWYPPFFIPKGTKPIIPGSLGLCSFNISSRLCVSILKTALFLCQKSSCRAKACGVTISDPTSPFTPAPRCRCVESSVSHTEWDLLKLMMWVGTLLWGDGLPHNKEAHERKRSSVRHDLRGLCYSSTLSARAAGAGNKGRAGDGRRNRGDHKNNCALTFSSSRTIRSKC